MFVVIENREVIFETDDEDLALDMVFNINEDGGNAYLSAVSEEEISEIFRPTLAEELLHYGKITLDMKFEENGYHRIRVIDFEGKKYFHHMFNGKVVEIFEV